MVRQIHSLPLCSQMARSTKEGRRILLVLRLRHPASPRRILRNRPALRVPLEALGARTANLRKSGGPPVPLMPTTAVIQARKPHRPRRQAWPYRQVRIGRTARVAAWRAPPRPPCWWLAHNGSLVGLVGWVVSLPRRQASLSCWVAPEEPATPWHLAQWYPCQWCPARSSIRCLSSTTVRIRIPPAQPPGLTDRPSSTATLLRCLTPLRATPWAWTPPPAHTSRHHRLGKLYRLLPRRRADRRRAACPGIRAHTAPPASPPPRMLPRMEDTTSAQW